MRPIWEDKEISIGTAVCTIGGIIAVWGAIAVYLLIPWEVSTPAPEPPKVERPAPEPIDPMILIRVEAPKLVQDMYTRMARFSINNQELRGIYLLPVQEANAYANGFGNMYITTPFLLFMKNPDELAFIIGHEMAHIALGHTKPGNKADSREVEYMADVYGLYLMQKAGYNPCNVPAFWKRLYEQGGIDIKTTSHPSHIQRAYYLQLPQCEAK